jgi:hypothetical protein
MSTTVSDGVPYPSLCPWFSVMAVDFGHRLRVTVEHGTMRDFFDVSTYELTSEFATVFSRALKIKNDMAIAEKVAAALADDPPSAVDRDARFP